MSTSTSTSTSPTTFPHPTTRTPITIPPHLTSSLSEEILLSFPAFKTWFSTLTHSLSLQTPSPTSSTSSSSTPYPFHKNPYQLNSIEIQSADFFSRGQKLGFLKLKADVSTKDPDPERDGGSLPGSVFLRGGSAAMMVVLQPEDLFSQQKRTLSREEEDQESYVILTVQPRIPAGSLGFVELPAGMLDDSGTFAGGAARELKEEVGIEVREEELVDMTALALSSSSSPSTNPTDTTNKDDDPRETLQKAIYPSPGGSDEFIPIFLHKRKVPRERIREWEGKLTGLRDEGEKITLRLCRLGDVWKVGGRDGKTVAAWGLFEGLRREGKI